MPLAPLAMLAASLWGGIGIATSISQSLWLDELHTAWAAGGRLEEVAGRAALGNQLPPYFWLLWIAAKTFGSSEIVWRAPSVGAWLLMLMLSGWWLSRLAARTGQAVVLVGLALIACDRGQIFYATEARPYALLALVNLAAWLALAQWASGCRDSDRQTQDRGWWLAWCACDVAAFWLQPTAVLSIAAQFVWLAGLAFRDRRLWLSSAAGAAIVMLAMLPAWGVLAEVWQRRQLWSGFAARVDLSSVLNWLPLQAAMVPLLVGTFASACGAAWTRWRESGRRPAEPQSAHRGCSTIQWWMWLCAWCVPCGLVFLLTASGIAPLAHRRYVFAAAVPFAIWLAHSWTWLRWSWLRLAVSIATLLMLLGQQGSLAALRHRQWPAVVRGEDWRGAVQWINAEVATSGGPAVVLCASNLIEGTVAALQDPEVAEYLALPLESAYRLTPDAQVRPLANDPRSWPVAVRGAHRAIPGGEGGVWLVSRCSPAGLERRLRVSRLVGRERRDFGGVQVMRAVRAENQRASTRKPEPL
ncbi:MAG: hypothetical protein ACTHOU_02965 [Aureliella sp.]